MKVDGRTPGKLITSYYDPMTGKDVVEVRDTRPAMQFQKYYGPLEERDKELTYAMSREEARRRDLDRAHWCRVGRSVRIRLLQERTRKKPEPPKVRNPGGWR